MLFRSEDTIGSGENLLADFQVGGVSKVNIDNVGVLFSRGLNVSENATFNKNVIINKNLFVQGCIVYNMSGTSQTLGDCI